MAFLEISGLRKRFGTLEVLKGIDLTLDKGGFLVLIGPSGCGKSTLLSTIAGLETISAGDIRIEGQRINDLHPSKRDIAMVFQSYALYPNMTVAENMAFGMEMRGVAKPEREKAVAEVAKTLQLGHLLKRRPSQLSGGSASASQWGAHWFASPASSCSTNRFPISTQSSASICVLRSSACTSGRVLRSSMSRTIRSRP